MKRHAGFTVVELVITITIMVILVVLGVVNLRSTQANARDDERSTDVKSLALYLEGRYTRNNGTYFSVDATNSAAQVTAYFVNVDTAILRSPGITAPAYSVVSATNATQTTAGVTPQPSINTYVYQPISDAGTLCTSTTNCRKFNLYYRTETTNTVQMVMSKNQ